MNNLLGAIKKFISNKNTVTVLAVLAGVIVLWYFYNYRVNQAITTIKIPYAVEKIDTGKAIDTSNIKYRDITSSTTKNNDLVTNVGELNGKYICTGTSIPANGFFHKSQVCEKGELANSVLDDMPDGYALYALQVNSALTYANSIMPGDYIDLYLQAVDENRKIIYGKLIESIQVLAVRDSSGKDVFWDSTAGDTAMLLFTVPEDFHFLLKTAELISGYSIKIIPVPRNAAYSANPGDTLISSKTLYNFIMNKRETIVD